MARKPAAGRPVQTIINLIDALPAQQRDSLFAALFRRADNKPVTDFQESAFKVIDAAKKALDKKALDKKGRASSLRYLLLEVEAAESRAELTKQSSELADDAARLQEQKDKYVKGPTARHNAKVSRQAKVKELYEGGMHEAGKICAVLREKHGIRVALKRIQNDISDLHLRKRLP